MKISVINTYPYQIGLTTGQTRQGVLLEIIDTLGHRGLGEVAPLPQRNSESLQNALDQLKAKKQEIEEHDWTKANCLKDLQNLNLYPSLHFGLETALLSILDPLPYCEIMASALFMGSPQEILKQGELRHAEGFTTAKLKVSNLSFKDASLVIHELKNRFRLRIDVNQAWTTSDSLKFFLQFSQDDLEYVEDPFQNPRELAQFTHPLAVEESFLKVLSLKDLELLPNLRALIFKPTSHGGLAGFLPLQQWANERGISLVLSSNFESDLGLAAIASLIPRLSSTSYPAVGIGTFHHMKSHLLSPPLKFHQGKLCIPSKLSSRMMG